MLKDLNKLWEMARRQAAAWQRWNRKLPHNRVRRPRLRDDQGRVVGHGPPEPLPKPPLPEAFCQKVKLPSGRFEVILSGKNVEIAYRQARHPRPSPGEVSSLPMTEEEIRRLHSQHCRQ